MKLISSFVILLMFSSFSCKAQQTTATTLPVKEKTNTVITQTEPSSIIEEASVTTDSEVSNEDIQEETTGTIRGKVVYGGGEVRKVLNVIKDENTCGMEDLIDESLLTDKDGGLNWAVVSISSEIENGKSLDKLPSDRKLDQTTCVYTPHVVLVGVGQELTINNMDHTLHNVRTASFMNDVVNKVQIYIPNMPHPSDKTTFTEPEVVDVVCDVHGWMKAYVHVVEHAYNAVSGDNGNFELTEVPPGKYTLKVWHEKLGEMEQQIEVLPNETADITFTYKELKE